MNTNLKSQNITKKSLHWAEVEKLIKMQCKSIGHKLNLDVYKACDLNVHRSVRSVWSNEETVTILKCIRETNINAIFPTQLDYKHHHLLQSKTESVAWEAPLAFRFTLDRTRYIPRQTVPKSDCRLFVLK